MYPGCSVLYTTHNTHYTTQSNVLIDTIKRLVASGGPLHTHTKHTHAHKRTSSRLPSGPKPFLELMPRREMGCEGCMASCATAGERKLVDGEEEVYVYVYVCICICMCIHTHIHT